MDQEQYELASLELGSSIKIIEKSIRDNDGIKLSVRNYANCLVNKLNLLRGKCEIGDKVNVDKISEDLCDRFPIYEFVIDGLLEKEESVNLKL